jgi:hypothetical protein
MVITRILLKNRELKTGWLFLRAGHGNWLTKCKELPKWPDVSSCSRHITPLRVFYSVLCQLLTSLEFSILEKQCAISLYFVWWPMFKFCMLYCTAKNFHYTKNKKFCNAKKILPKNMTFSHFPKKWHYRIFYILLNVSFSSKKNNARKKIGGHHASFPTIRGDRPFLSEFRTRMSS